MGQGGLKDFLITACAALGAVLGVINTVAGLSQRRVRLRVIPKLAIRSETGVFSHTTEQDLGTPAIEVINLSAFPVTIAQAGFNLKGDKGRLIPVPPFIFDNRPWPRRLESRESVTVYFPTGRSFPRNLNVAFATTDCQQTRYGDSPALKAFRARLQN